jgi:hypothetical protein
MLIFFLCLTLCLIFYLSYPSQTVAQSTTSAPKTVKIDQSDPFTVLAEILIVAIVIGIVYVKWRYRRSKVRIFLSIVFVVAAYFITTSTYLPHNGVDLTEQKFLAVFMLFLAIIPLFYKTRKKERMPFPSETKKATLEDQDYKCAFCGRGLSRFNIDFDHKNGNRSDNRSSNCRALCTPCHRERHAYGED